MRELIKNSYFSEVRNQIISIIPLFFQPLYNHQKVKYLLRVIFNDIVRDIDNMDADVITFEASRSDLKLLDALNEAKFETQVGPGVYDIHSPRVPSQQEIVDALHKIIAKVPQQNVWVNPDCGLKTRGETETTASLKNLVAAAKQLREE